MAGHISLDVRSRRPESGRAMRPESRFIVPVPMVATLIFVVLWITLVAGVALAVHRFSGMTAAEAWAFAVAIISYIYLFVGLVIGLVVALRAEDRAQRTT